MESGELLWSCKSVVLRARPGGCCGYPQEKPEIDRGTVPFYEGQPAFGTLNEFLRANDFVLVKLKPTGLYDMEIIEFDCFYIRSESHSSAEVILWKRINDVGDHNRIVTWGY
jgi:hypothetical protein